MSENGSKLVKLSRRERQIMDVLYRVGRASVADVQQALPDPPSYSSVRALLRILEEKGHVKHEQDEARYLYSPAEPVQKAAKSAITQVLATFFNGSVEKAVATMVSEKDKDLSDEELDRLLQIIEEKKRSRQS